MFGPSSGGTESLAGGRGAPAATGWDNRRALVYDGASPAGLVFVASRPEGRQTFRRRRGNHVAGQQSGISVAYWYGPRARFPQSLSSTSGGDAQDRRPYGNDLQFESLGSRNRFPRLIATSGTRPQPSSPNLDNICPLLPFVTKVIGMAHPLR